MNMIRRILCRLRGHDPRLVHSGVYRCARCRQVWAIQRRDVSCEADEAIRTQLPHPQDNRYDQLRRISMGRRDGMSAISTGPLANRDGERDQVRSGDIAKARALRTGVEVLHQLSKDMGKAAEDRGGDWWEEQRA